MLHERICSSGWGRFQPKNTTLGPPTFSSPLSSAVNFLCADGMNTDRREDASLEPSLARGRREKYVRKMIGHAMNARASELCKATLTEKLLS
jgi:hypothetical protein